MSHHMRSGAFGFERWTEHGTRYSGVSHAMRIRHVVEWQEGSNGRRPLVTFYYEDRWLSVWAFEPREVRELERALAEPVRLMICVESFTGRYLEGSMHALPVPGPHESVDELGLPAGRPLKIPFLGAVRHELPRRYGRDEGQQAAIDAVLFYLYRRPDTAVERLLGDLRETEG